MINTMIKRINEEVENTKRYLDAHKNDSNNHWEPTYQRAMSEIRGMIKMLEIASGKKYGFNKEGLFEK